MADRNASASCKRVHIVLIPGFAGFDALGQVEYYSGITPLFHTWKTKQSVEVVLHYFDNLPTAAVVTRASRLRSYLAKRIARGEIAKGDALCLVGHSTGGLDIRQLVQDLYESRGDPLMVDGGVEVAPEELLDRLQRVVFLSVPQWGTNIADWVRSHNIWREAVVAEMRAAVAGSQVFAVDRIEERVAGGAACLTGADLLRAVQDSLTEANDRNGKRSPIRTAEAQEAASELALYLRHVASDFRAIDDLTSRPPAEGPLSPAHFDEDDRDQEVDRWEELGIRTLSYVTVGSRPFRFLPGSPAPLWELSDIRTYPEVSKDEELSAGTDVSYRSCYRACAGGPFTAPTAAGKISRTVGAPVHHAIELWDNDGIVNTASMLWPRGENVLVAADHLDIVGQFRLIEAPPGTGRVYRSYDALKSTPPFPPQVFEDVWMEIFDFCIGNGSKGPRPGRQAAKGVRKRVKRAPVPTSR